MAPQTRTLINERRMDEIVEDCRTGKTINEMAAKYGLSYFTTQKMFKRLEDRGLIFQSTIAREKSIVWYTTEERVNEIKQSYFHFGDSILTTSEIVQAWLREETSTQQNLRACAAALIHLYIKALRKKDGVDIEPSIEAARQQIALSTKQLRLTVALLEELLLKRHLFDENTNPDIILRMLRLGETFSLDTLANVSSQWGAKVLAQNTENEEEE